MNVTREIDMTGDEVAFAAIQHVQAGEPDAVPAELAALPQHERDRVLEAARRYVAGVARATADAATQALVDRLAAEYERHEW